MKKQPANIEWFSKYKSQMVGVFTRDGKYYMYRNSYTPINILIPSNIKIPPTYFQAEYRMENYPEFLELFQNTPWCEIYQFQQMSTSVEAYMADYGEDNPLIKQALELLYQYELENLVKNVAKTETDV